MRNIAGHRVTVAGGIPRNRPSADGASSIHRPVAGPKTRQGWEFGASHFLMQDYSKRGNLAGYGRREPAK